MFGCQGKRDQESWQGNRGTGQNSAKNKGKGYGVPAASHYIKHPSASYQK